MIGDPGRIRTCDLQLRRLLLYPLSYGAFTGFSRISGLFCLTLVRRMARTRRPLANKSPKARLSVGDISVSPTRAKEKGVKGD